jgi:hypothetical protein
VWVTFIEVAIDIAYDLLQRITGHFDFWPSYIFRLKITGSKTNFKIIVMAGRISPFSMSLDMVVSTSQSQSFSSKGVLPW